MGELELSMGVMRARVDQIEPMVVDLTTAVEVYAEREEMVVPQSPLLGLAPEDAMFRLPSGIGQLVPIQDVPRALGVEPFRDFGAEEERQAEEMERSGYQEANCQGHSNPKLPVPEEGTELDSNGRTYTTGRPTNTA